MRLRKNEQAPLSKQGDTDRLHYSRIVNLAVGIFMVLGGISQFFPIGT